MQIFRCGDEATVRANVARFMSEMDARGEAYGTPGDGPHAANTLHRGNAIIDVPEEQHVWLVLSGRLNVAGGTGVPEVVSPGQGVFWDRAEPWSVDPIDATVTYVDVDGPALTVAHFEVSGA